MKLKNYGNGVVIQLSLLINWTYKPLLGLRTPRFEFLADWPV
jgi:hypothetical protein